MSNKKYTFIALFISIIAIFSPSPLLSLITEGQLKFNSVYFVNKLIADNPEYENDIRVCMSAVIPHGNAGIRLMDKFGLFIHDINRRNVYINKARFLYNKGTFVIFLLLEDKNDGRQYTMFLEYSYDKNRRICSLVEVYFSLLFEQRMKEIKEFFMQR
jgi:hypothetical protein